MHPNPTPTPTPPARQLAFDASVEVAGRLTPATTMQGPSGATQRDTRPHQGEIIMLIGQ